MRCPFAVMTITQVKDSRPTDDNAAIRRRRFLSCGGSRFTTSSAGAARDSPSGQEERQARSAVDREKLAR